MRVRKTLLLLALCWTVRALAGRVIDGDTFEAQVRAYPHLVITERVRVLGVDTPEKATAPGDALRATRYTTAWLAAAGGEIVLRIGCEAPPYDHFGRLLGVVTRGDGHVLADDLIAEGLVKR